MKPAEGYADVRGDAHNNAEDNTMSNRAKGGGADAQPDQICALYTDLALHPDKDFGWGKGKDNARRLGYQPTWLERLPEAVWESAAAVGNPFALAPIRAGDTVLDLGCGAGADACIAALLVGVRGRVIGVDITPAMVQKARRNVRLAGLINVTVCEADVAYLPLPDGCIDTVISNGSINLAPDKARVFGEARRVLRPGGRLQFADMVRTDAACCATTLTDTGSSWADCVAGTLPAEEVLSMLRQAGFTDVAFVGFTDYKTSQSTVGATFRALRS